MARYRRFGEGDDVQMEDGDRGFVRMNNRMRPNQLEAGELSLSLNGRMQGYWQPRRGIETLSGNLTLDQNPLRLPFWIVDIPGGLTVTSATRDEETVTLEAVNSFAGGLSAYTEISGLTGGIEPNGIYLVTSGPDTLIPVLAETFEGSGIYEPVLQPDGSPVLVGISSGILTYELPGATGSETYGGAGRVATYLRDDITVATWGSCTYSNPNDENEEYIVIATNGKAQLISIADGTSTDIDYPGLTINAPCDLLQCFDRVRLFRQGQRTLEWTGPPSTAFTEVPAGDYTQPQVFQADSGDLTISGGKVTVTVTGNVTVNDGDIITIYKSDSAALTTIVGRQFPVIETSATSISFYAGLADFTPAGTDAIELGKNVSVGGGFMHSPAPPWGVYHQRRLWCPFWYSQSGDDADPVFVDRGVRDEIAASDILDADTFDQIANQFRVTGGTSDFLVGVAPFYEDVLLVFMRNSLHAISGISGELNDTSVNELTREIGCLARKTIAMHGPEIMFLSDNGVYSVAFIDQYNLRGVDKPVSAPIQPFIDRINTDLASASVGIYFANRYYIAVPLDTTPGEGDATGNNSILVYNFLNGGWESVDTVSDERWSVMNFHIARAGERNDLYAVNSQGGVHKLDSADSDVDLIAVQAGEPPLAVPVSSRMATRQYDFRMLDRKRFSEMQIQVESSSLVSDGTISFTTEDPDDDAVLTSLSSELDGETLSANEGASIRARIGGRRGQGGLVTFTPLTGRPLIHSVRVLATVANRQTIAQK